LRTRALLLVSLAFAVATACGGSSSVTPDNGDGGGRGSSSGGSDAASGTDGPGGRGGSSGGADALGGSSDVAVDNANNTGNGQDCTSCTAPQVCCATVTGGQVQSVVCAASTAACPSGTSAYACTGPADCPGQVCCETGGGTGTSCASSCPPMTQVCQAPADCPGTAQSCPMNGARGDIGYGICTPPPEGGAGGPNDAGAAEGGGQTGDGASDGASIVDAGIDVGVDLDAAGGG
jgi:hypothetical protein